MRLQLTSVLSLLVLAGSARAGTVGYYRFEEGAVGATASTVLDSSGFGNHGTGVRTPAYSDNVPVHPIPLTGAANRRSLRIDKPDQDYVQVGSSFIFNRPGDATLEFWINAPLQGHTAIFWGRGDTSDLNRFHLYLSDIGDGLNHLGMDYREPGGTRHLLGIPLDAGDAIQFTPNVWTHIAIVRSGNNYLFYKDCELVLVGHDPNPVLPTSVGWRMSGRDIHNSDFGGFLDEVRTSDRALDPSEFLCHQRSPEVPEPGHRGAAVARYRPGRRQPPAA